jgi:DNA polymerase sigma
MLQLDISFDGPEHHGLAANQMIAEVMRELPLIQPLVLVLKQFLNDRGLLQAFTGGLSSYCLFLMVTRYLQEHPSSWDDCGSLLMGFLDFYGNAFDPRATGISVGRRQYFARQNCAQPQQLWNVAYQQHLVSPTSSSVASRSDLIRRNSFNDNATMDGLRGSPHGSRPPRFQPSSHHRFPHQYTPRTEQEALDHAGRPYTFDPLFVEDPLSIGNNVGRNAFRIFQVQRAFSDAHRALVASLEWDIHSSHDLNDDGGEYPLLNCLLQSEDVFYELVDDAK